MVVAEECEIIAVAARPTAALSLNIFIGFLPFVFVLTMTSRDVIDGDAFRFTPRCQAFSSRWRTLPLRPNETQAQSPLTEPICAANFDVEAVMCKLLAPVSGWLQRIDDM